jgi:putative glutamine amidotransferase
MDLKYLPVVLPIEYDYKMIFSNIKIDAVILTGGNDLYTVSNSDLSLKRDNFERGILEVCLDKKIPVWGICRGMQIIAHYFDAEIKPVKNHAGTVHNLLVSEETKFKRELENLNAVNSYHDFAVDNISNDFVISARSNDGIIEAIEHKKYKIFAHMWHPERQNPFVPEEISLINSFINGR